MPRRRPRSTPVVVIGCALAAALLVAVAFVAFDVGGDDGDPTTAEAGAAPEESEPPTEDRLSSESRLGYAGLGPLQLGMSEADAGRAARATFVSTDGGCLWRIDPEADFGGGLNAYLSGADGLVQIGVASPAIRTISGIHVGSTADDVRSTYANAVPGSSGLSELTITNPQGRHIRFFFNNGVVSYMELTVSAELSEGISRC